MYYCFFSSLFSTGYVLLITYFTSDDHRISRMTEYLPIDNMGFYNRICGFKRRIKMILVSSSFGAVSAELTKSFVGSQGMLKVGGKKFILPDDIAKSQISSLEEKMTGFRAFIIVLLAVTTVGLIIAIPLYFAWKKHRVIMKMRGKTGEVFTVGAESNKETAILRKYDGIDTEF